MNLEDDAALSSYEFVEWLEQQPELDVKAGPRDSRKFLVILANGTRSVEAKLWELLTIRPSEANLDV